MRALLLLALLGSIMALESRAGEQQLPIDSHLPKIGGDWIRKDAGSRGDHSWVSFDSKDNPGDVLSFSMTKVSPSITVSSSPVNQASVETFQANGSSMFSSRKPRLGTPIDDIVRHRIVSVSLNSGEGKQEIEAIEYTYIYERAGESAGTIAHGYCVVVGGNALFVQHTSSRVINSDIAFEMVAGMLSRNLKKPVSYMKGKILKSNR